jgi:hypothetical protein
MSLAENGLVTKANAAFGLDPAETKRRGIAEQPTDAPDGATPLGSVAPPSALGGRPAVETETAALAGVPGSGILRFRRELGELSANQMSAENTPRSYRAPGVKSNKEDDKTSAVQTILVSFDFDQNGDSIRIHDADGSIYEGKTVAAVETTTLATALGDEKKVRQQVQAGRDDLSEQKAATSFGHSLHFRVSGTNHNLKQLVVLDGVMTSENRAAGLARTNGRTANPGPTGATEATPRLAKDQTGPARANLNLRPTGAATVPQAPSEPALLPLSRIRAKARIGASTNEVVIDAIRVTR